MMAPTGQAVHALVGVMKLVLLPERRDRVLQTVMPVVKEIENDERYERKQDVAQQPVNRLRSRSERIQIERKNASACCLGNGSRTGDRQQDDGRRQQKVQQGEF